MSAIPDVKKETRDINDTFPYSGMRLLGAIQINIGVLVFILGIVDLILTMTSHDSDLLKYGSRYEIVVTLTVVSSPLWCGLWYAITGGLGACWTRDRAPTLLYSKIGFLVLNVLCCALFGPACAVINAFLSYTRHNLARSDYQWLISLIVCFLAIIEVVVAAVSAFVMCCCSAVRPAQVHIFVNPSSLGGTDIKSGSISENLGTSFSKSGIMLSPSRANANSFSSINNDTSSSRTNLITPKSNRNSRKINSAHDLQHNWVPIKDDSENRPTQKSIQIPVKNVNGEHFEEQSRRTAVKNVNENHLAQQSRWTPVMAVREHHPIQQSMPTPVAGVGEYHPKQHSRQTSVVDVIEWHPTQQPSRTPVMDVSERPPAEQPSWTPFREHHLTQQPTPVREHHLTQQPTPEHHPTQQPTPEHPPTQQPTPVMEHHPVEQSTPVREHHTKQLSLTPVRERPTQQPNRTPVKNVPERPLAEQPSWTPVEDVYEYRYTQEPKPPVKENFKGRVTESSSYLTLKKWALPQ